MPSKSRRTPFRPPRPKAPSDGQEQLPADDGAPSGDERQRPQARRGSAPVPGGRRGRTTPQAEPERLHKVLAQTGIGSRRDMEEMIISGRISVNGLPAHVGQLVGPNDRIKVNGKLVHVKFSSRVPRVVLYHKPEGEIVSRDDPEGRESVFDALPRMNGGRWVAVGRLDYNTSGLLLFTSSGELANRLMHPRYQLVREYAVRILGDLSDEKLEQLREGIELDDGPAHFETIEDGGGQGANHWYRVTLCEGRNREVRRMFEAVGTTVSRLIRVRYGPFMLPPHLKRGKTHELDPAEVQALLRQFGLSGSGRESRDRDGEANGNRAPQRGAPRREVDGNRAPRAPGGRSERGDVDGNRAQPEKPRRHRGAPAQGQGGPAQKAGGRPGGRRPRRRAGSGE